MKATLTAETIRKAIEDGKPASMTQLAHRLGYRGSVSSSVTSKFRALVPEIGGLLAANGPAGIDSLSFCGPVRYQAGRDTPACSHDSSLCHRRE